MMQATKRGQPGDDLEASESLDIWLRKAWSLDAM